jgi:hypothetical protein
MCILQVENDKTAKRLFAYVKVILYVVFQVDEIVKGGSTTSESTVGIREEISTLHHAEHTKGHHALHRLAQAKSQVAPSVITCQRAVFAGLGTRTTTGPLQAHGTDLCPYATARGQQKRPACGWEVVIDSRGRGTCCGQRYNAESSSTLKAWHET